MNPAHLVPARGAAAPAPAEWCEGESLRSRASVYVPAAAVFFPWEGTDLGFSPTTTGLAAGGTREDAEIAGLLECIERDAFSVALARGIRGVPGRRPAESVLPTSLRRQIGRARADGIRVVLRDVTSDLAVPTVLCTIAEPHPTRPVTWSHLGIAARPTLAAAARAAWYEAAQSRLTDIQGAREDLEADIVEPHPWFLADALGEQRTPSLPEGDVLAVLVERTAACGLPEPVSVELSPRGSPLTVVRVVAPGMEGWAFDPTRIGARVQACLDGR